MNPKVCHGFYYTTLNFVFPGHRGTQASTEILVVHPKSVWVMSIGHWNQIYIIYFDDRANGIKHFSYHTIPTYNYSPKQRATANGSIQHSYLNRRKSINDDLSTCQVQNRYCNMDIHTVRISYCACQISPLCCTSSFLPIVTSRYSKGPR